MTKRDTIKNCKKWDFHPTWKFSGLPTIFHRCWQETWDFWVKDRGLCFHCTANSMNTFRKIFKITMGTFFFAFKSYRYDTKQPKRLLWPCWFMSQLSYLQLGEPKSFIMDYKPICSLPWREKLLFIMLDSKEIFFLIQRFRKGVIFHTSHFLNILKKIIIEQGVVTWENHG